MIVDCHAHIWDEGWQPIPYRKSIARSAARRRFPYRDEAEILPRVMSNAADPSGAYLIADMDAAGVDITALMMLDTGIGCHCEAEVAPDQVLATHIDVARKYRGRIFAFFGMDPRRPNVVEKLYAALDTGVVKGIKLYPPCGYYPYDAICRPLLEVALERNLPVLSHTGETSPPLQNRFAQPVHLGDMAAAYPTLNVIMGHVGRTAWCDEAVAVATRVSGIHLDLSTWWQGQLAKGGVELMVHNLRYILDHVGAHRVLFGTDRASGPRPRRSLTELVDFWRELPDRARKFGVAFSEEEMSLIMGQNMQRLLNIEGHGV